MKKREQLKAATDDKKQMKRIMEGKREGTWRRRRETVYVGE